MIAVRLNLISAELHFVCVNYPVNLWLRGGHIVFSFLPFGSHGEIIIFSTFY